MGYISIIIRIPTGHQSQTHDCLFLQCLRDITSFRTPFSSFWIALSFPFRFPFPLLSWFFSFSLYFISFGERQVGDGGLLCLWGIFFICFLISIFICGSERCTGTSTPCPPVFNTGTFFFLSLFATVLVFFIGFFIGEKEWRRGFNCLFYLVFFFFDMVFFGNSLFFPSISNPFLCFFSLVQVGMSWWVCQSVFIRSSFLGTLEKNKNHY